MKPARKFTPTAHQGGSFTAGADGVLHENKPDEANASGSLAAPPRDESKSERRSPAKKGA